MSSSFARQERKRITKMEGLLLKALHHWKIIKALRQAAADEGIDSSRSVVGAVIDGAESELNFFAGVKEYIQACRKLKIIPNVELAGVIDHG